MKQDFKNQEFESINKAYNQIFKVNHLSIGLIVPIETYANSSIPSMLNQLERIKLAENLGFSAVWLRDIPFNVPSFGDVGQIFDPFAYLGFLCAQTTKIALGVGSIILPLRHPAHIAKSAASIDVLSQGRLILGVASGDRAEEYPALNIDSHLRGEKFRESFEYISQVWKDFPIFENNFGTLNGTLDMLPKPLAKKVPMLITGSSQQSSDWLAKNGDGCITYPRNPELQKKFIDLCREKSKNIGVYNKPISQSLYIDLDDNFSLSPQPIHLGYRLNTKHLVEHLKSLEKIGVNHVAINLRFNQANIEKTLEKLARDVLPHFNKS